MVCAQLSAACAAAIILRFFGGRDGLPVEAGESGSEGVLIDELDGAGEDALVFSSFFAWDERFLDFWHTISRHRCGWSLRKRGWWNAPVSGPLVAWRKPHRLSFRVKEGYFVLLFSEGRCFGRTRSAKTSGRMITNERPCGSQEITSDNEESDRIAMRRCGKISLDDLRLLLLLLLAFATFFLRVSHSSSLTTKWASGFSAVAVNVVVVIGGLGGFSTSFVSAVAASTRWDKPPHWSIELLFMFLDCLFLL
mmetsp:Transcript_1625/g.2185  ORF Transcript_1625/g.2185 Transcript_1625/m.2185 type:complete len:251 (-) Transcript_1625:32-784(-)